MKSIKRRASLFNMQCVSYLYHNSHIENRYFVLHPGDTRTYAEKRMLGFISVKV